MQVAKSGMSNGISGGQNPVSTSSDAKECRKVPPRWGLPFLIPPPREIQAA
jgi:hypothetical protein